MGYSINSTLTDKRSKKNLSSSDREVSVKNDSLEGEYINCNLRQSYILKGSKADGTTNKLEVSVTNNILHHLTLIDPSRLNSVIARAVDGSKFKLEWYHKNYLDHVYAVSDDTGDILEHYRYTAFGEVTIYDENGAQVTTTQIDNHILWNTRRRDEVTGYYMYKFRHYSAELGRWPSRDPIEEDGGVNLYGFVGNDPIGKWDRLGQRTGMGADCYYTGLCGGDDISGNAGPGIHEPPKNPCVFPCCKVDECKACCLALGVNALAYCAKIPHVAGQWACRTAVALMIVGCQSGCVDCPGR